VRDKKKKTTLTIDSAAILFNGIRVAQFFVFCVVFCELLVVFLVVLLTIVLSVIFRFIASD
jgi:hypothetical protein